MLRPASPNVATLIALRFVQGAAGAAGIVISRAVVRDLFEGTELARFYALADEGAHRSRKHASGRARCGPRGLDSAVRRIAHPAGAPQAPTRGTAPASRRWPVPGARECHAAQADTKSWDVGVQR